MPSLRIAFSPAIIDYNATESSDEYVIDGVALNSWRIGYQKKIMSKSFNFEVNLNQGVAYDDQNFYIFDLSALTPSSYKGFNFEYGFNVLTAPTFETSGSSAEVSENSFYLAGKVAANYLWKIVPISFNFELSLGTLSSFEVGATYDYYKKNNYIDWLSLEFSKINFERDSQEVEMSKIQVVIGKIPQFLIHFTDSFKVMHFKRFTIDFNNLKQSSLLLKYFKLVQKYYVEMV